MASVHSRLVDMLTQIGRRVVRLEEKWNVKLEGQKVHVKDERGVTTDFGVEHTENTIMLIAPGHKFDFEVIPTPDTATPEVVIQLSNGRRCTFDVNQVGVGQYTVDDGLVSLHQRELLFRADEQTQMNSMRAEIARLRAMTTVEDIPTPAIVKYYEENLSEPVDDVNEEWHDMVWKTAVETSALRGLLAMRQREFARVGANHQLLGEIDLLTSKLERKSLSLSGICADHSKDISVQLYKELNSFHKLVEELVREKDYWGSSKKKNSAVETANYQLAIQNTHRYPDYSEEVERIAAEITQEVTDALTREAEEKAKAKVEEDSQVKDNIQAPPEIEKPTLAQLRQQIAEMKHQIATLDHEINQTLPSSMQKEFKAINKLSDELIREYQKQKKTIYTNPMDQETKYWAEQVHQIQSNEFLLCEQEALEQYNKLKSAQPQLPN